MTRRGFSPERLARMQDVMARHVESEWVPGLVTGVSRRGEVQIDAIGMTAFGGSAPMEQDTLFRLDSVTKPLVAVAALILVEECTLRLDDPVDSWLPELAEPRVLRQLDSELDDTVPANRPISLRDLLTFRLGTGVIMAMPGTYPIQAAMEETGVAPGQHLPALPADEYLKRLASLPLLSQPGERWLYNTGFDVLGVLLARVTGRTLDAFMRERIFAPLDMADTSLGVARDRLHRLATAYWADPVSRELAVFDGVEDSAWQQPVPFESGASGLVSTASDLLRFGEMMLNQGRLGDVQILSRSAVETMTSDQILPRQKGDSDFFPGFWDNTGWGFGVAIDTRRDDLWRVPGRFGWDGGCGTSWYVDPANSLVSVLLTQHVWDFGVPSLYPDFWTLVYQAMLD